MDAAQTSSQGVRGSEGSLWLGNRGWSSGPLPSRDGPSRHAGEGAPSLCGGASGEGWKLGSSQGPRVTPPGAGEGGGQFGNCQELRAASPGAGRLSEGTGQGAGVIRPPDPVCSLLCPLLS